jgi:hypothetical protein
MTQATRTDASPTTLLLAVIGPALMIPAAIVLALATTGSYGLLLGLGLGGVLLALGPLLAAGRTRSLRWAVIGVGLVLTPAVLAMLFFAVVFSSPIG